MTPRSAAHATFTIERVFAAAPRRVFQAWANPDFKRQWASCHDDWTTVEAGLDFRVGGHEVNRLVTPEGKAHDMQARYFDIVPDRRIVYGYDMEVGGARISVSLVTVELAPVEDGTAMTFTEQAVFFDGYDGARDREGGTQSGFDRLAAALAQD